MISISSVNHCTSTSSVILSLMSILSMIFTILYFFSRRYTIIISEYNNVLKAVVTMSGKMSVYPNQPITDFITGRIRPVKFRLTLTGHCKKGPQCVSS